MSTSRISANVLTPASLHTASWRFSHWQTWPFRLRPTAFGEALRMLRDGRLASDEGRDALDLREATALRDAHVRRCGHIE